MIDKRVGHTQREDKRKDRLRRHCCSRVLTMSLSLSLSVYVYSFVLTFGKPLPSSSKRRRRRRQKVPTRHLSSSSSSGSRAPKTIFGSLSISVTKPVYRERGNNVGKFGRLRWD